MRWWCRAVLVAALTVGGPANAEPPPEAVGARERARAPFREGAAFAADNRWQEALAAFERALAIYPHARTWFNIGYCERSLGRSVRAWRAFTIALSRDRAHGELNDKERERAKDMLDEIERGLALVTVELPDSGARVDVDGDAISLAPGEQTLWLGGVGGSGVAPERFQLLLPPGEHEIRAVHRDGTVELTRVIRAGENEAILVPRWGPPGRRIPVTPPPAKSNEPWRLGFAIGLGGGSASGLIAGGVLSTRAASLWSEARDACPEATRCPDDRGHDLSAQARREANAATVLLVNAGVAAAGAVILGIYSAPSDEEVAVEVGATGAGLRLSFH